MGELPQALDADLTGWLAEVLAEHGRLTRADLTVIGQGEGFVGQLARAALTWEEAEPGAPRSVIVKLPTRDPGGLMMGQMMGLYDRESRFYAELAGEVPVRVPACYVNIARPDQGAWALVLEDLAPLRPGDQVAGATPAQAHLAVEQLARLHARFYGSPELDALDWLPTLISPMTAAIVPMFEGSWTPFLAEYGPRLSPRSLDWVERFAPRVPRWMEGYAEVPCTVTHGDFRLDNQFFGDDGQFALVDWQMSMRVPGSSDLVYFLVTNLNPHDRRVHEWDLIDAYLEGLRRHGVSEDLLPRDMVLRGYREGALLYAVMFVSTMTIERTNARGQAFFDELVGRTFAAVDDLEAGTALGL